MKTVWVMTSFSGMKQSSGPSKAMCTHCLHSTIIGRSLVWLFTINLLYSNEKYF